MVYFSDLNKMNTRLRILTLTILIFIAICATHYINTIKQYPLTVVSGYWRVGNKHDNKYNDWFKNTLKINAPYIFFGTKETIAMVRPHREGLPTHYIECNITEFYSYKYAHLMITHPVHCPSKELNMIWNEKVFLMEKAAEINPYNSDYFAWVDAGISSYRETPPPIYQFPDRAKLYALPKKIIYSSSDERFFDVDRLGEEGYHHISGTFVMHSSVIPKVCRLYRGYLDTLLVNKDIVYTDQIIFTYMLKEHPELFYNYGHGYCKVIKELF